MNSPEDKILEFKNISHDLQNILASIVNNINLIKRADGLPENSKKIINIIENNSLRASEIVQEFLSNRKVQKRKIDVSILVEDVISSFINTLPEGIKIKTDCEVSQTYIWGNYNELFRVFLNLITNAKEAVEGKGKILFKVSHKKNDEILFSVIDSGKGISEKNIEKIFDPGFSTKNKGRESGLGLNIVKNIINDHKGSVDVKSKINKGTEFKILIPRFFETNFKNGFDKKILIADDDNGLRESLSELFESEGFKTLQANNGKSAIDLIKNNSEFDLLLIDKKMPDVDGLKCVEKIRSFNRTIPVILITGVNFEEHELAEINSKYGISRVVKKPYDFNYLKEIVESIIL